MGNNSSSSSRKNTKSIDFSIFNSKKPNNDTCNGYKNAVICNVHILVLNIINYYVKKMTNKLGKHYSFHSAKTPILYDYSHIIKTHSNDIKLIANELIENYGFKQDILFTPLII